VLELAGSLNWAGISRLADQLGNRILGWLSAELTWISGLAIAQIGSQLRIAGLASIAWIDLN
jgi:hypothetical protein